MGRARSFWPVRSLVLLPNVRERLSCGFSRSGRGGERGGAGGWVGIDRQEVEQGSSEPTW